MSKIIGVTVGTPISPSTIKEKIKPVTSINNVKADENGNVAILDWFSKGVSIPSGSDLNDYRTNGKYFVSNNSTAATIKNCPTASNFVLFVFNRTEAQSQLILTLNGKIYARSRSSSSWNDWVNFASTKDVETEISGAKTDLLKQLEALVDGTEKDLLAQLEALVDEAEADLLVQLDSLVDEAEKNLTERLDGLVDGVEKNLLAQLEGQVAGMKQEVTPVRGTDYWTETDKQEIVDAVLSALPQDTAAIDMTNWENGSFTQTYVDDTSDTRSVTFDDEGRPVSIGDSDGGSVTIEW